MNKTYPIIALLLVTLPALTFAAVMIVSNEPVDPSSPKGQFMTGNAHFLAGEYELAAKDFEQIVQTKPNDESALNNLAVSYNKIGNHAGAASALKKLTDLKPGNANYHFDYAINVVLNLKQKNEGTIEEVNDALKHFKIAQELNPNLPHVQENILFVENIQRQYYQKQ